jgi:hypothetical protein
VQLSPNHFEKRTSGAPSVAPDVVKGLPSEVNARVHEENTSKQEE